MNKCYCGKRVSERRFKIECYKYDLGIGVIFCSDECLSRFIKDYYNLVKKRDNRIVNYEFKYIEGTHKKIAESYLYFFDKDNNIIKKIGTRGLLDGYEPFDKHTINLLTI